jgi:Uncharacterized conserved protein
VNTLDVRALPPRERHERIFESIDALKTGDTLRLVNDHDPLPVRYQLDATRPGQVVWQSVESGPQQWAVDITSRARVVDARPMLARREEPFAMIMDEVATLRDDEVLVKVAASGICHTEGVLADQGFDHVADALEGDERRVTFMRR